MKTGGLTSCLWLSVLAHAAVFGMVLAYGWGRKEVQLPEGDSIISLTLISAPDTPVSEAVEAQAIVTPVPTPAPPVPVPATPPPVVVAPAPVVALPPPAIVTEPAPLPPPPKPAEPVIELAPEVVPQPATPPAPVQIAKATRIVPEVVASPQTALAVTRPNEARGDNRAREPGTDRTTVRESAGVRAHPAYRKNPDPLYPLAARRRGQEGTVVLIVRVTADGKAAKVEIKKKSGFPLLDEAALKAVKEWEFEPARLNSAAVDSQAEVPVRFRLNGGD